MSDSLDWSTVSAAIATWVQSGSGLDAAHVWWAYEARPRPTVPYIAMSVQQVRGIGHDWTTSEGNPLVVSRVVESVSTVADTLTITGHDLSNGDGPVQFSSTLTLPSPLAPNTDYWVILVDANTIKLATSYIRTGGQQPLGSGNPVTPIDLTSVGSGVISMVSTADTVPAGKEVIRRAQGFREVTVHMECLVADGMGFDAMRIMSTLVSSLQLNVYNLDLAGVGVSDIGQSFSQGGIQALEGHRGGILEPRAMWDFTFYLASDLTGFDTIIETIDAEIDLESEGGASLPAIPVHIG